MNDGCGKISEHLGQQRWDNTDGGTLNGRQRRTVEVGQVACAAQP